VVATSWALLLRAASHVVWDGFTHASGWAVRLLPGLTDLVRLGSFTVPWFKLLQHSSSLLGLAVLAAVAWQWIRRQPVISHRELWRRALWPAAVLMTAGLLNGARFLSGGFQQFVVAGAVAVTLTLGLGLVLLGVGRPVARS
jgi:hypothetical protein